MVKKYLVIATLLSLALAANKIPRMVGRKLLDNELGDSLRGTDQLTRVTFNGSTGTAKVTSAYPDQRFQLDFGSYPKTNVIRVDVINLNEGTINPIVCFSSKDERCEQNRQQLNKNMVGNKTTIWVTPNEYRSDNFYVTVHLAGSTCSEYQVDFTAESNIYEQTNFQHFYMYPKEAGSNGVDFYVLKNTPPKKEEEEEKPTNDDEPAPEKTFLTFYAVGSPKASIDMTGIPDAKPYQFKYGKALTIPKPDMVYSDVKEYFKMTVRSDPGDYIMVGAREITGGVSQGGLLQLNGGEVSGFLVKDLLEEECFMTTGINSKSRFGNIFITGNFHERIGELFLKDKDGVEIDNSGLVVTNGQISKVFNAGQKSENIYVCVRFPTDENYLVYNIPFTLRISEFDVQTNNGQSYAHPMAKGMTFKRTIPKNSIAFYSAVPSEVGAKKVAFNMLNVAGFAQMAIDRCTNYPFCTYDDAKFKTLTKSRSINRLNTWYTAETKEATLDKERYVMVVKCLDGDSNTVDYCEFETSVISEKDEVELVEREHFSQFALKGEKGTFVMRFPYFQNLRRVLLDINVMSGDINFNLKDSGTGEPIAHHKYYLSNKMMFNINLEENEDLTEIKVAYTASLNSFFTITYKLVRSAYALNNEGMVSGLSNLVAVDPTTTNKSKFLYLSNLRRGDKKPFVTNFYTLNCEFSIRRYISQDESEEIEVFDGYAQEVLTAGEDYYNQPSYFYQIVVTNPDLSNYNHKMCMLYVAGVESSSTSPAIDREIVISENIGQQMIFENGFEKFRFLYPHSDPTKDLVLDINIIDIANYYVKITFEGVEWKNLKVAKGQKLYIPRDSWENQCKEDQLCSVVIEVGLESQVVDTNPMAEITIRQVLNVPTYLVKGSAKKQFVCGERFYYLYTDIGKNEQGEVLVDFLRGTGKVFGKVVRKDQTSVEEEANWRDIYRMPSEDWEDSLEFNHYLKKLYVSPEDTADCIEGCYLLISIQSALTGDYSEDYRFYPFSILTRVTPNNRAYTDIPKVVLQMDEFIVGNVDVSQNERIYEFYEIWIPHDCETVDFDFQAEVAGLYVNLGGTRPTTKNADFKLTSTGKDSIIQIKKDDILTKAKAKKVPIPYPNTIQDLSLVIGIWADKAESIDTTVFSLRVHLPLTGDDDIDIIEVNADQKVLCNPNRSTQFGRFRCLFMVVYDDLQLLSQLLISTKGQDPGADIRMYASFIDKEVYEKYDMDQLRNLLPSSQRCDYDSFSDGADYIYTDNIQKTKYLYVTVASTTNSTIEFMSTFYTNTRTIQPNPSTEQLFGLTGEQLTFEFKVKNDIMVDITTLHGEGMIYWENDAERVYHLRGRGDRLSITSGSDFTEEKSSHLIVKNRNPQKLGAEKMNNPGFAFYITYRLRNPEINFDELDYGKSIELAYKATDLPLFMFTRLFDTDHDVTISLNFIDLEDTKGTGRTDISTAPFTAYSALIKESTAYLAKQDSDMRPTSERAVQGAYDAALKTAMIYLSKEKLRDYKIKESDNPVLYFGLDKTEYGDQFTYERFTVEAAVTKENDNMPVSEKLYHYGRLSPNTEKNVYALRTDKNNKYMRVVFARNSYELGWALSERYGVTVNSTFIGINTFNQNGKTIVTFQSPNDYAYVYLTIFRKNKEIKPDSRLYDYTFKYINADSNRGFREYSIHDNRRRITWWEQGPKGNITNISCVVNKIDGNNLNVTYILKVVSNITHVIGERCDTIAFTESPAAVVYYVNPKVNENNTVTLHAYNVPADYTFIQVIAKITEDTYLEYESYNGIFIDRPYEGSGGILGGDVPTSVFILVGGLLLAIVVALVVTVLVFRARNQSLLDQVKHVSFQKTNTAPPAEPNLVLKK